MLLQSQTGRHHSQGVTGPCLPTVSHHSHGLALQRLCSRDQSDCLTGLWLRVGDQSHCLMFYPLTISLGDHSHWLLNEVFIGYKGELLWSDRHSTAFTVYGHYIGGICSLSRDVLLLLPVSRVQVLLAVSRHYSVHISSLIHCQLLLLHLFVHGLTDLQHLCHQQVPRQIGNVRHETEVKCERGGVGKVQQWQKTGLCES
ncbi:hypothetical protein NQD34_002230 [Periophthalmus magnuspinnatus]|nr:hypothetical protein NQD34_002230 [Periophthalmus magnuspinnatus]